MSSKSSHGTEVSPSSLSVSMPSGSGLRAIEDVGEDANDQHEEARRAYEGGGAVDDNNGADEDNGEVTGSVVVQGRVEDCASWGLDRQWRMPDTHLANRQDYALSDAEEKLKATILKQRRHVDVLTHPGRLWLCGLAPRPTKMSGIADFQFGKCNPLRVRKQNIIINCRGERGRLFIEKEVVGQDYQIVVRSASRFVGSGVPVNPEGSVRHPGRGKGVMGLSNLSSAIEQEAATQPTLGDHHANDRQASPRKDTMDLATIQRLRAEKKAAAAAEKSSTSAVVKDHVAAALSSARQTTPPALEVAPTGVGNRVAQQPDMAELQEEVKMAKKMEEDARSALEQEKLGRQADKVAASKDKAALEAQVAALESKLQNDFIEVLDAAVVSARHMASKYMGVDLSDVPLENPGISRRL
ncbi:hypothetical protein COLO4_23515 [Corchorus olitorius]|uniref:Uncharacterized protein n=1 Tax=Corchorus olitorius TaxID=93759 RepID=A0A1R3IG57_9ROSI|nr:hypothetical protein COLO4_23515 [Corchorus olitorius]